LAGSAEILAVVKANAYGHGAVLVARALEALGVRFLAVALIEEGVELRRAGVRVPILVLGGSYEGGYDWLLKYGLTPTLFRREHVEGLARAARAVGHPVKAHLKVDTGMGRLGVRADELEAFLDAIRSYPEVQWDGLMSHFANADLADALLTREQVRRFRTAHQQLLARGLSPQWRHISNSAGVIDLPEVRDGSVFNLVRPGLMLYGVAPADRMALPTDLRPILSWRTRVIHLKAVSRGDAISYGSIWTAPRPSRIATLPVGYADGYSRLYSNRASVLIRGQRAPIVGRVCMDLCMIDVTDIEGVQQGDEVVLLGRQGKEQILVGELAELAETIPYEVLCALSSRVPRVLVHSDGRSP
ncbi:MAG TPA: alanine racemase, partial [Myxococcales bacterium]